MRSPLRESRSDDEEVEDEGTVDESDEDADDELEADVAVANDAADGADSPAAHSK